MRSGRKRLKRVGAIPFRISKGNVYVLFVTSQTRKRWVLPKGVMKSDESDIETCQREVFEEAGVSGRTFDRVPIEAMVDRKAGGEVKKTPVTYYPMLVKKVKKNWPEKNRRKRVWIKLGKHKKLRRSGDQSKIIRRFEKRAAKLLKSVANG